MTTGGWSHDGLPFATEFPERASVIRNLHLSRIFRRVNRLFMYLFFLQWIAAIVLALTISPVSWDGRESHLHVHVFYAVFFGALLTLPPLYIHRILPDAAVTRHAIAIAQMLWSSLLIQLTGGRIETHFHIFGSLAFAAFYRDPYVVLTATATVMIERLGRGALWPQSIYGIVNPEWWRLLEHAFWVGFEDFILLLGISEQRRALNELSSRQAELEGANSLIETKVDERTRELAASREQYRLLLETTKTIPWEMRRSDFSLTYVGPQIEKLIGVPPAECSAPAFLLRRAHPDDRQKLRVAIETSHTELVGDVEVRIQNHEGRFTWMRFIGGPNPARRRDSELSDDLIRGVMIDVTLTKELDIQLREAQKLESVGRLASGVAHEINTPVQFVSDSVYFVRGALDDLRSVIDAHRTATRAVVDGRPDPDAAQKAVLAETELDADYILENVPKALDRSIDGLKRISKIVRSMKEFAHPDQTEMVPVDINRALESTLTIARNEFKYVADLETDFREIPVVVGHAGEINQVFLNIIVNAAHAIGDVVKGTDRRGVIKVSTKDEGGIACIAISDTGAGIPEDIRHRIFEPFFTTKEVGRGTGQGLAISRTVIVEKHKGSLTFESEVGKGTTFFIRLPVPVTAKKPELVAV